MGIKIKRGNLNYFTLSSLLFTALLFLIIFSSKSLAFGVSTPYFENNTIKLEPGQSYVYTIRIQNNDKIGYNLSLLYSSDRGIATLRPTSTFINAKSFDTPFDFDIFIPKDAKPGDVYRLSYQAKPILNTTEASVSMVVEIARYVNILIVDEFGQGYRPTFWDTVKETLGFTKAVQYKQPSSSQSIFTSTIDKINGSSISPIIFSVIILVVISIIVYKLWKVSKQIYLKLSNVSIKIESDENNLLHDESKLHHLRQKLHEWKKFRKELLQYYSENPNKKIKGKDLYHWMKSADENIEKIEGDIEKHTQSKK